MPHAAFLTSPTYHFLTERQFDMSPTNPIRLAPAMRTYKTLLVLLLVAGILAGGTLTPAQPGRPPLQDEESRGRAELAEAPLPAEQLRRVAADKQFKAAMEIIESQNETVDMKEARLVTSKGARGASEIVFRVTVKGTSEPGEYAKLVYSEQKGKRPFVFFDEKRTGAAPEQSPVSPPAAAKICFKPWGSWKAQGIYCAYRYLCVLRNQKATYKTETRSRNCPGGTQTQTRTSVVHCGC